MSHAFDARFSPTSLSFQDLLVRLEPALQQSKIDYRGEVVRLHSRGGIPTVMTLDTTAAPSLQDVPKVTKSWWGLSLCAVSGPLSEMLGRSEAMEVYVRLFPVNDERMIVYNEASAAFAARAGSDALANDLAALLVRLCVAAESRLAIYAEEDGEATAPTLEELERWLDEQARAPRALGWAAVVADRILDLDRARALAGPWASRVRSSTAGFVVLPFLSGDGA